MTDFRIIKRAGGSGFTITGPSGEPWAMAIPQNMGSRGTAHVLRYPDTYSIRRFDENGKSRGLVTIQSHPDRVRMAGGAEVPDQPSAILLAFAEALMKGWIKGPLIRDAEKKAAAASRQAAEDERNDRHAKIERGIRAIVARGLTDDETFALTAFCKELSYSYLMETKP